MKEATIAFVVGSLGLFWILNLAYANADVKGYTDVHGCTGECYEEYIRVNGTLTEQLLAKRMAMQSETSVDRGGKLYVNCNMCHGMKGEGGIGPKLSGSTSIVAMLDAYKAGGDRQQIYLLRICRIYRTIYRPLTFKFFYNRII